MSEQSSRGVIISGFFGKQARPGSVLQMCDFSKKKESQNTTPVYPITESTIANMKILYLSGTT